MSKAKISVATMMMVADLLGTLDGVAAWSGRCLNPETPKPIDGQVFGFVGEGEGNYATVKNGNVFVCEKNGSIVRPSGISKELFEQVVAIGGVKLVDPPVNPDTATTPPSPLTFAQLRETNVARCNAVFHPIRGMNEWSPTDWATALGGECGELLNEVKKLRRLGTDVDKGRPGTSLQLKRITDELADLIIYADLFAARLGIDLPSAITEKFNEVSDRRGCRIKLPTNAAA